MVLLARIATVICSDSPPSEPNISIVLGEIIRFIERKMSSTILDNKKKSKLAIAALEGPSSRHDHLKVFDISDTEALQSNFDVDRVIAAIEAFKDALPSDLVKKELGIITYFIKDRNCRSSMEDLYGFIERLFADMLNEFLSQLPKAIFKEIIESHPEDFEKVIRSSLKLLCKVESLDCEGLVQWTFPNATNINNLITNSSSGE